MRQGDYGSAKFFYRKGLRYYGLSAKMGVPAPQLQMALNQRGFNAQNAALGTWQRPSSAEKR
jgi:hypothetical protein